MEIFGNSEICLEFVYKISEILRADFKIQGPYIYACEKLTDRIFFLNNKFASPSELLVTLEIERENMATAEQVSFLPANF